MTQTRKRSSCRINAVVGVSSPTLGEHTRRQYFENVTRDVIYYIAFPAKSERVAEEREGHDFVPPDNGGTRKLSGSHTPSCAFLKSTGPRIWSSASLAVSVPKRELRCSSDPQKT